MTEEQLTEFEKKTLRFLRDTYTIIEVSGEGTFSTVYKAVDSNNRSVALKVITKTSSPSRVVEELKFLRDLEGTNNCMPLLACHRHEDQIIAVFPYFEHTDFRELISSITLREMKVYLFNLLTAISHTHRHNIVHRDLKPSNFLFNRETQKSALIDFGLAQYCEQTEEKAEQKEQQPVLFFNNVVSKTRAPGYYERDSRPHMKANRAGTRGFRAPEVLFKFHKQTKAIDMWSVGVIFLTIATAQYPFFYSTDDVDALVEIGTIFGHSEMRKVAKFYGRIWKSNIETIPEERIPFEKIMASLNPWIDLTVDGYDLLYRLMDLYYCARIKAEDALKHSFFADL